MRLITPNSLHYPITVTRLRFQQDEEVTQGAALFDYRYETTVIEGTEEDKEGVPVKKTLYSTYETDIEGTVGKWLIKTGTTISRGRTPIVDIEEACRHEVQFQGMCAECGKDMTEVHYNTVQKNTSRATISAAHSHAGLLVSAAEASRSDEEAKRRLISSRKLSLVVDLDQTIIHATVDSTVAEWQRDPTNPNHDAVKDVRAFQLLEEAPGARGCWYYIKLRPGLKEFLEEISKIYELHIYTMGTRAYAQNIAMLVDPDRKIFGDRILSRDESGSMTVKSLRRLFPVDTKMVVIIDDRGDVWHWCQNLIKVTAFDFFVGIGDINSSFLPKRPGIDDVPPSKPEAVANGDAPLKIEKKTNGTTTCGPVAPVQPQANGDVSTIDQLMSMSGTSDANKLEEQTHEHDETIAAQLTDRPLLQKQKMLDAAEEAATSEPADSPQENGHSETPSSRRHNLLRDDDNELHYLQKSLQAIHSKFYNSYDTRSSSSAPPSRVSELRPNAPRPRAPNNSTSDLDLDNLPDVTTIMANMKTSVLRGVHIVFSGVLPLGTPIQSVDIAIWAKSLGAVISENITRKTTHVIASPARRTAKVRQAWRKSDRISIVTQKWLYDCLSRWQRLDEEPYRIHRDITEAEVRREEEREKRHAPAFEQSDPTLLSSSDDEAALTEEDVPTPTDGRAPRTGEDTNDADDEATDTDTEKELRQHMPSLSREDSSPHEETKEDWDDIDGELAEFLGSDAEDDGSASEAESAKSGVSGGGSRKRKRAAGSDGDGEQGQESDGTSRLQVRKKKALGRTSSLNNVEQIAGDAGAVAVPSSGAEGEGKGTETILEEDGEGEADEDEDEDGGLEAELAAEMMRQDEEDGVDA
ncbi:RNA polymerase II subunit A C-terminal domain phosphatase [Elsinoe australis]|uniref:RNA polymerase II subunit A C-terminal domain phosphatase n=1 Tax=Elsinoe australis TaxID=40998 RepID=A0A2P7ZE36_9PEZI|nr:RNA polymerase II subunit A C-terminal domain phosphatase [Elsinoe australis]